MRLRFLRPVFATAVLSLAACNEERTHTVDEFKADSQLREATVAKCKNNPGELEKTPNCINAGDAAWKVRLDRMKIDANK
jgi:hypothetical protein